MELKEIFAHNLRFLRKKHKITKTKFGKQVGIKAPSTIYEYENARTNSIRFDYIESIAKFYNIPIGSLFVLMEEEPVQKVKSMEEVPGFIKVPKKLFHASRVEMRDAITSYGLSSRVDLFETVEEALQFVGGPPCDVYLVRAGNGLRKGMTIENHPMWKLYSYHQDIPPKRLLSMSTHR